MMIIKRSKNNRSPVRFEKPIVQMTTIIEEIIPPNMLVFTVPPGIGDIAWPYSKVIDIAQKRPVGFKIANNEPKRALLFVDLLPYIKNLGYAEHGWPSPYLTTLPINTDLESLPNGNYSLFMNEYLEQGNRIEAIFPKQKTHFHYDLNISTEDKAIAKLILDNMQGYPKIAFYASSYAHRTDVGFWDHLEWVRFIKEVNKLYPNACFVAIGANYDNKTTIIYNFLREDKINVVSAVGLCNIGATFEILKNVNYFFSFPSGLATVSDTFQTPTLMFYWKNVSCNAGGTTDAFLNSYADPENVASGKHLNVFYTSVENALEIFKDKGMKFI